MFVQYVTTCDQVTLRIFLFTPVSPVSSSECLHLRTGTSDSLLKSCLFHFSSWNCFLHIQAICQVTMTVNRIFAYRKLLYHNVHSYKEWLRRRRWRTLKKNGLCREAYSHTPTYRHVTQEHIYIRMEIHNRGVFHCEMHDTGFNMWHLTNIFPAFQ